MHITQKKISYYDKIQTSYDYRDFFTVVTYFFNMQKNSQEDISMLVLWRFIVYCYWMLPF